MALFFVFFQKGLQVLNDPLVVGAFVKIGFLFGVGFHIIELTGQAIAFAGPAAGTDTINEFPFPLTNTENTVAGMMDEGFTDWPVEFSSGESGQDVVAIFGGIIR